VKRRLIRRRRKPSTMGREWGAGVPGSTICNSPRCSCECRSGDRKRKRRRRVGRGDFWGSYRERVSTPDSSKRPWQKPVGKEGVESLMKGQKNPTCDNASAQGSQGVTSDISQIKSKKSRKGDSVGRPRFPDLMLGVSPSESRTKHCGSAKQFTNRRVRRRNRRKRKKTLVGC